MRRREERQGRQQRQTPLPRRPLVPLLPLLVLVASCSPTRVRPGPPRLVLDLFQGTTVASPDTIYMGVHASDPNGLDSVAVSFEGVAQTVYSSVEGNISADDTVGWIIPANAAPNTMFWFYGYARDLTGDTTVDSVSVTVVSPGPTARRIR